jgi:hypothetical protein
VNWVHGSWTGCTAPVHGFIKPEPSADRLMTQIRLREGVSDLLISSVDRATDGSDSFSFLWLRQRGTEHWGTMVGG